MEDTQRATPDWSAPPEIDLRRIKTMVEDEMMIKLGAKKETVSCWLMFSAQATAKGERKFIRPQATMSVNVHDDKHHFCVWRG